jgi:L-aminopeptidase/D-esterase-like protein
MRWLEERGFGFETGVARVPIVPAAILFDLGVGRSDVRPDATAGYAACEAATMTPQAQGNVGAGTGASVGKILGFRQATKTGLGTASQRLGDQLIVAALVAVNAFGDVYDPQTQRIIAGVRSPAGGYANTVEIMIALAGQEPANFRPGTNTTLAVVATNAQLSKNEATKMAQMAQAGLARTLRPSHTHLDGDTIFALSYGRQKADINLLGTVAAGVLAEAVVLAVKTAEPLADLPSASSGSL